MTEHQVLPSPETTVDVFSREAPPVLAVDPGDTVVVSSLDASGYLARQTVPGEEQPRMFAQRRGHCLTGPVAVLGAEPGMVLVVHFVSLRPGPWGWTVAAALDNSRPVDPARIRDAARRPGRPSIDANAQGGPAAQVRVRVSGDLLARLDEQAAMSHQSRSALVRTALAHYLDASR